MKTKKLQGCLFAIFMLFMISLHAQNLVPNPSFENYSQCPDNEDQLYLCNNWFIPTFGSSDYYNGCNNAGYGVPSNAPGYQEALTGQAYAGIISHFPSNSPANEYIQAILIEPLIAGQCYEVEMFTNLANGFPAQPYAGISHIGIYLSVNAPPVENGHISLIPQVYYTSPVVDTFNWTQLTGFFIASGGEQIITIGNFFEPGEYEIEPEWPPVLGSYYYIEDVRVEIAQEQGTLDLEAEICEGECYEYEGGFYCAEGTYEIPVQLACVNLVNLTVNINEFAIADIALPDVLDCNTTEITLDASGSSPGYYEWTGPNNFSSSQQNPTVYGPGIYTLIVGGIGLCETEISVEVFENIVYPDILTEVSGILDCFNPVVTLSGSSNTQNVSYHWTGPGLDVNSPSATADEAGDYTLTITGPGGCSSSETIAVLDNFEPPDIFAEVLGTLDCNNLSVVLTGGSATPGVGYSWTGPGVDTDQPITSTNQPGTYIFTVLGPNGCVSSQNVTVVEENTGLDIAAEVEGILNCENDTVTLTGSTPAPGVTYQWSGPGLLDTVPVVEATAPGEYTFSISDGNGCSADTTILVEQNIESPEIVTETPDTISCNTQTVTLNAENSSGQGILNFEWQDENQVILGTEDTLDVNTSGTYTLILTDEENGCTAQTTINAFGNTEEPTAEINASGTLDCNANAITLDGSNSMGNTLEFQWLDDQNEEISIIDTVDISLPGTYTLIVTDASNGCSNTAEIVVEANAEAPLAVAGTEDLLDCNNTEASLDGNGSTEGNQISYEWQNPAGDSIAEVLQTTVDQPGIYALIVFDNENGCSSSATIEVLQDIETPTAVAGEDELLTCDENSVILDGGASNGTNLTFQWTNSNNEIISETATVEVQSADSYTLTVIAENGCTASDEIEVTLDTNIPIADVGVGGTLNCELETITLGGSETSSGNNIEYQWLDGGNMEIAVTPTTETSTPGTYTLIVTDVSNNCSTSAEITIPEDIETPTADAGEASTLNCVLIETTLDGSQSSSGQSIEYQWLDSNGNPFSDQITQTTDQAGSYTLIVTNTENHCSAEATVLIDQNLDTPTADAGPDGILTCDVEEITLDGSASAGNNLSFEWFNQAQILVGNQSVIQVSQPGIYTLVATNTESQCSAESSATVIPDENLPTAIATFDDILTCEITSVNLDGSSSTSVSGNIAFEWLDGDNTVISNTETATAQEPGIYTLVVIDTENGCSISTIIEIMQDIEPPIAIAGENQVLTCTDTELTLDGSASTGQNLEFEWQDADGNTISMTALATATSGGTYFLFVTNSENGCSATASVDVIPDVNLPTAIAGNDATLDCNNTEITLDGSQSSAGQNIEYEWQNNLGNTISTTQTASVTEPGTYTFFVFDADNNCLAQDQVTIDQDIAEPTAVIDFVGSQEIDCNNSSIVLDATASTPFGLLTFEWTTIDGTILSGSDTPNPEIGGGGGIIVTVTNTENGCTAVGSIVIVENLTAPTAIIAPPNMLNCVVESLEIDATASSSGSNFNYNWSSNPAGGITGGATTLQPTIDQPGTYIFTIINNDNGCQTEAQTIVLEDITPPDAVALSDEIFDCITENITLSGEGSSTGNGFVYQWSGSGPIDNPTGLSPTVYTAGNYVLQVTNTINGCSETAEVLVTEDENTLTAAAITVENLLCSGNAGSLTVVSVEGGYEPYLYSIDGGQNFSPINFFPNLGPGNYEVLIQDAIGCEIEETAFIQPAQEIFVTVQTEANVQLGESYQIEAITNILPSAIDTIIWSPTENLSCTGCLDPRVLVLTNDIEYTVTVIDTSGCQASATIQLRVDKSRKVFIPNVFSPNDDGTNDFFTIYTDIRKIRQVNTFQVYDRWGEQVFLAQNFQPNDPAFGWNGALNGEFLNPAVFVYFAEIEFIDGVTILYKGDVAIVK